MKVVILTPHQDDEMCGAGCAILEWVAQGADVHVAWITDGRAAYTAEFTQSWFTPVQGKTDITEDEVADIRKNEAISAMKSIGIQEENLHFFELPDQGGDANIEPAIPKLKPLLEDASILMMPANGEIHVDHAAAFQIGIRAVQELSLNDIDIYLYKLYSQFKDLKDARENPAFPTTSSSARRVARREAGIKSQHAWRHCC